MLIVHLSSGLLVGAASAVWGWNEGYSLAACFGLYVLGGNVGTVGSAALQILGSSQQDSTRPR